MRGGGAGTYCQGIGQDLCVMGVLLREMGNGLL
jgi:hypothetical protein